LDSLGGELETISAKTFDELRHLDFSAAFRPPNAGNFCYYHHRNHRLGLFRLSALLDLLPKDLELLMEMGVDSCPDSKGKEEFAAKVLHAILERDLVDRVVLCSKDLNILGSVRAEAPSVRFLFVGAGLNGEEMLDRIRGFDVQGVVTQLGSVTDARGRLTDFGRRLQDIHRQEGWRVGAALRPGPTPSRLTREAYEQLCVYSFIWSVAAESMIHVAPFVRKAVPMIEESFAGKKLDPDLFSLGYAKANPFCEVFQDDGVHVKIREYSSSLSEPSSDLLEKRVTILESKLMDTAKDWPFYSGGGLGVKEGIRGNFVAEVDYQVEHVGQATTLEMAVLNVDPGAHQAKPPSTFRHKDSFFDPHGAPPYAGIEHDEDDGYRVNWNLGTEYDNNQYGKPVGDGKTPRRGRLRLERRGPYFSGYYRNDVDAPDWVCVGVVRNDSLNEVVYLRCVGKRWRQEKEDNSGYYPILANEFIFSNLQITRYLP